MVVSLIDIDSKIPNLALKKIERYYLDKGAEVVWNNPLWVGVSDKIFVSCVFTKNKDKCLPWEGIADIGGSGYDLTKTLPDEIERVNPKINFGFTTRGCIRQCEFCIVPQKEGMIRVVGDIYDLWDGVSQDVVLLDNNILAQPSHFFHICQQLKHEKLRVDFNQGLDHRLLTAEIAHELKQVSHKEYRFAFDSMKSFDSVAKALGLLKEAGINRCSWYVLVGFDTTFAEDLERLNYLRDNNQGAYVQRFETCYSKTHYVALARWANQHHLFQGMSWDVFLNHPANTRYKKAVERAHREGTI
jgi:uncharacterized protein YfbU (UPF0304 family)